MFISAPSGTRGMLTNSSSPLWEARVVTERRIVFLAGSVEEWFEPPSQEWYL